MHIVFLKDGHSLDYVPEGSMVQDVIYAVYSHVTPVSIHHTERTGQATCFSTKKMLERRLSRIFQKVHHTQTKCFLNSMLFHILPNGARNTAVLYISDGS